MYYEELITFVTLTEIKSFTKTAEILRMSQPSVSLQIKNLEKEFQTELFIRSPKILKITPTGELLYERAKQIISIYEQTKQDILDHHHSMKGKLIIGASFTIGEYVLPSILPIFQQQFPKLELQVVIGNTDEIVQYVRLLEVDIGLIEGQTNEKDISVHPFMEDTLYIIAANDHPLASSKKASITDLQNQTWITREEGSGTRAYLNHIIRSNGLKVKSFITISSNQGIKEAVINGMGLSLLSDRVIDRDIKNGYLSIIPIEKQTYTRTFSYIFSPVMKNKHNVDIFIQALNK